REARKPALAAQLQQLQPPQVPQPIKVAILRPENAAENPAIAKLPEADAYIDLPLTIPKLERVLSL
ncbi:hypothetical protein IQ273_32570, partial [Nodosilinea sp. LEGE 07298]|uniref:hypothetical protein n=1 Tax=Nodosilinea sp. LEGE 07298 TaxID=2777970 RepID=UPI001880E728